MQNAEFSYEGIT